MEQGEVARSTVSEDQCKQLAFCVILSGGCLGRGSGYLILTSADLYPTMIIPATGEVREKKNECEVGVIIEGVAEEMG